MNAGVACSCPLHQKLASPKGGVFVAEAIAALRPTWHLLLSDTDVAPTALFEVSELVDLCKHLMHEELRFGEPGILIGTEPHQDINAGMAIFLGSQNTPRPGSLWCKISAARRALLEKPREELPHKPAALMPPVTLTEPQFRAASSALTHAAHVRMAALTRTPLAGIKASTSTEFLTAWAILGAWTCTRVWPTPNHARWPQACCPINQALAERKPYLGGWARSSFEQGALCALAAMSSQASMYCAIPGDACFQCHGISACVSDPPQATLPLFIHYYGNKDSIHELDLIRSMPFLCQSLFGHEDTPPFWCQREWRAAADFAITCNKRPSPCWRPPKWQAVPPLEDTEAIGPNEVLALPANIRDGAILPASSAKPTAAPSAAEVELQDTAVPSGTEVLHVYSTGLNGSLPCDLPAEQSAATVHLRGAYGPSLSQMYADQGCKPASEADLPRAPLRSHAEYLEFCRCLLDEHGHRCWREMLVTLGISDPDAWVRYAAKYATLPPLPAQLALPAPVWSIVSSIVLLYLQPSLLAALAERIQWAFEPCQHTEIAMHFAGFSAGSYTAIALEVDYRLLCQHFQLPLCPGTTTVGALGCPVRYLLALLSPVFQPDSACLLSAQRALLISHVWEDILCVWHPKIDVLRALSAFCGYRIFALPCSFKFLILATLKGLTGLAEKNTTMAIYSG